MAKRMSIWTLLAILAISLVYGCLAALQFYGRRVYIDFLEAVNRQEFDSPALSKVDKWWFKNLVFLVSADELALNQAKRFRDNKGLALKRFKELLDQTKDKNIGRESAYEIGRMLVEMEAYKDAVGYFEKALRLDPKCKKCKYELERLYEVVVELRPKKGSEAGLEQAPGTGKSTEGEDTQQGRAAGRGSGKKGL